MKPGYFVAILTTLLIAGDYLWKNRPVQTKEVIIILIAALAAGTFAGLVFEGALSLFRLFMSGRLHDST